MVRRQLVGRGITDPRVLAVMGSVPRDAFVPAHLVDRAYADGPLPIGHQQTISQPFIVALMTQAARLHRRDRVLEIGTGSGYQTAILARLAGHVWTVERIAHLSGGARAILEQLHIGNVTYIVADGARGYPPAAPYDAIVAAAAAPHPPPDLLAQLADGGRFVIPIGDRDLQQLTIVTRRGRSLETVEAGACRFVPLLSEATFS